MIEFHGGIGEDAPHRFHATLNAQFDGVDGPDLLELLITRVFPGRIALISSFGAESVVLLHMVAAIDRTTPIIFLNTGKLFGETLAYRESVVERFGLTDVRDVCPGPVDTARTDPNGDLWNSDAASCCRIRKVLPMKRALTGFSAWITGRKRFQSICRAILGTFEVEFERIKVNPLVNWQAERIASYIAEHELPVHPLIAQGYSSIGCGPCTSPVGASEDARAGRWRGDDKTECGIHFEGGQIVRHEMKPSEDG